MSALDFRVALSIPAAHRNTVTRRESHLEISLLGEDKAPNQLRHRVLACPGIRPVAEVGLGYPPHWREPFIRNGRSRRSRQPWADHGAAGWKTDARLFKRGPHRLQIVRHWG